MYFNTQVSYSMSSSGSESDGKLLQVEMASTSSSTTTSTTTTNATSSFAATSSAAAACIQLHPHPNVHNPDSPPAWLNWCYRGPGQPIPLTHLAEIQYVHLFSRNKLIIIATFLPQNNFRINNMKIMIVHNAGQQHRWRGGRGRGCGRGVDLGHGRGRPSAIPSLPRPGSAQGTH